MRAAALAAAAVLAALALAALPPALAAGGGMYLKSVTLYTATTEVGRSFVIRASFVVANATLPIKVYLVINNYIVGYPVTVYSDNVSATFYVVYNGTMYSILHAGSNFYYLVVVDSSGSAVFTPDGTIYVYPRLSVSLSATGSYVFEAGEDVTFRANATGGDPPYVAFWYVNGALLPAHNLAATVRLYAPGPYTVKVVVYDSLGASASANISFIALPGVSLRVSAPPRAEAGIPWTYSVNATGGTPPYTIYVLVNGTRYPYNGSVVFPRPGAYNVTFVARDAVGSAAYYSEVVYASPPPSLAVTLLPAPGGSFLLQEPCRLAVASPSGGVPPYSVTWYVDGRPVATGLRALVCGGPGRVLVEAALADSLGGSAAAYAEYYVTYNMKGLAELLGAVAAAVIAIAAVLRGRVVVRGF